MPIASDCLKALMELGIVLTSTNALANLDLFLDLEMLPFRFGWSFVIVQPYGAYLKLPKQ